MADIGIASTSRSTTAAMEASPPRDEPYFDLIELLFFA
jgi:hypothetical protein